MSLKDFEISNFSVNSKRGQIRFDQCSFDLSITRLNEFNFEGHGHDVTLKLNIWDVHVISEVENQRRVVVTLKLVVVESRKRVVELCIEHGLEPLHV